MCSSKAEKFQRIVARNSGECLKQDREVEEPAGDDASPWFHCDYPTFVNRGDYLEDCFCHPLLNPFLYRHRFDELKEIDLFLQVGKYDFLLDQNIELAKLWQGRVCLDVFDKLMHAFLQLHAISTDCAEAFEIVVKRHQEACGLI